MYRNCTKVVPPTSDSAGCSDLTTKNPQVLEWQTSGVAGRNARSLAHDTSVIQRQKRDISGLLRASSLFAGLSPSGEVELCDSAIERSFSNRKVIFHEDDLVRFVDIVVRGSVKITQVSPEGDEVILRIERPGSPTDGMGEEKVHSTTAWAVRECVLLSWDAKLFANFTEKHPAIQRNATAIMARRLRALSESFCDLSTARVPQRLARLLLRLSGGGSAIQEPLGLSREELAQMTGTSLFTTSRLLREWADLDIVHVNRSGVLIEDLDTLTRLSQETDGAERSYNAVSSRRRYRVLPAGSPMLIDESGQLSDVTYDL